MKKYFIVICLTLLSAIGSIEILAKDKVLNVVKKGEVIFTANVEDIDYMRMTYDVGVPTGVVSEELDQSIFIKWNAVSGASSYNVYRSIDGKIFSLLTNVTTPRYRDRKPLVGDNYYAVEAVFANGAYSDMSESTAPITIYEELYPSGFYLGVIGFSAGPNVNPIDHLTESRRAELDDFIDGLQMGGMTTLYYSVDKAISELGGREYPRDINRVSVITFTDGVDEGSVIYESQHENRYSNGADFLNAISGRIANEKIDNLKIDSYTIGFVGMTEMPYQEFRHNLEAIASSSDKVYEVDKDFDQVKQIFKDIANDLVTSSMYQTISVQTIGFESGTKMRFVFDGLDPLRSNVYIEGIFDLENLSLTDVEYHGMESISGNLIYGEMSSNYTVKFIFDGVRTESGDRITGYKKYRYYDNSNKWLESTESSDFGEFEENEIHKNTSAIILNLDCSSSLGENFVNLKSAAKDFINTLMQGN